MKAMEGLAPKYNFARDGFMYLLSYATLVIVSVSVNFLAKSLVNRWIPDAADITWFGGDNAIIGFLAAVIIALPIFVYVNFMTNKWLGSGQMKHDSGVRHWLIYITLVVVILIIIWQLIALFVAFLGGTLALQFGAHTLITLLIASLILWYQWWHLKFFTGQSKPLRVGFKVFEWVVLATVAGLVVWTFATIDSPAQQRLNRLDQIRVERLTNIRSAVQEFYGWDKTVGTRRLPQTLAELEQSPRVYIGPEGLVDPVTKTPFGYRIVNSRTYQLGATFATEFKETTDTQTKPIMEVPDSRQKMFYHGIGEEWFTLTVE